MSNATHSGALRAGRTAERARRRQFLPPQHGAWAMLIVPYLAGLLVVGADWVHLPLLGAWLSGYLLSYFVFLAVKSRRVRRYRDQLWCYGALFLPLAVIVVWARPQVGWYAPGFVLLLGVNTWYAWRRRERAFGNDVASVLQSCLLVFVVGTIAGVAPTALLGVFAACLGYFLGTVLYVKTMIRERDNPSYLRWSVGYHAVVLALSTLLIAAFGPWLAIVAAWLFLRAWLLPGRGLAPKQVGLAEISHCLALLVAIWLTFG